MLVSGYTVIDSVTLDSTSKVYTIEGVVTRIDLASSEEALDGTEIRKK